MFITAGKRGFQELNYEIRNLLEKEDKVIVRETNGQRYIGSAMDKGKRINIYGTPGNDMGAYLNGGDIEVFGNGQEAIGNTMNGGSITVHGHVGDTLGYAMRDGSIYVEKRAGSRAGIHIKEFENMKPVVVIGGIAGAFLGEYMAGGILMVLGLDNEYNQPIVGAHCATGMHGGKIFVRGEIPSENISAHITVTTPDEKDKKEIVKCVREYCKRFDKNFDEIMKTPFMKLIPTTSRPYANLYTAN